MPDERAFEAKLIPLDRVAEMLQVRGLRRAGPEFIGPCPMCGGKDRFGINVNKATWLCRKCDGRGDGIDLVRFVLGCGYKEALGFMVGDAIDVDPAERARRRAEAEARARKAEGDHNKFRQWAIDDADKAWCSAIPAEGTLVRDYLELRGIPESRLPRIPKSIRFIPSWPYKRKFAGALETLHVGPAMVACIVSPQGKLQAIHQTWIDVTQPNGKARVMRGEEQLSSKMVRGSKKGNAIRLTEWREFPRLVMAEGIETTLTALAWSEIPDAMFWAGVDLGNMSGRRMQGKGMRYSGEPDMTDSDAFVPPPYVSHMTFVRDGDSDPVVTEAQLQSGLRRAKRHRNGDMRIDIIDTPEGVDLNDMV